MKVLVIVKEADSLAFILKAFKDKTVIGLWPKTTINGQTTIEVVYK